ncbi:MAG TPA: cobalt ECF transporter T component CbiQ [Candidatus Omnitrophica bacterium]|nr:cobalt ECF transporter T component CbiQ [Candidatus Omnitrophota bacterium]
MRHSYLDAYNEVDSIIHRIDARIKCGLIFLFILITVLTPPTCYRRFLLLGIYLSALIGLSRIPIGFFLKRSLMLLPFLLLLFAFLPFIPQDNPGGSYNLLGKWEISQNALIIIFNSGIKATLSFLALTLLISTTGFNNLMKAFQMFKIPQVFVHTLAFMYRYIFVIQDELQQILKAKKARTIKKSKKTEYRALSSIIGTLFLRSYERAENIYYAMIARGFTGKIKTLNTWKIKTRDLIFAGASVLSLTVIILVGK